MIQCKMCGGSVILTPDRTIGVCEYCGSTNTYGKISDEQRAAAFNRGNDFRRASEFDNALAAYEQILREDDTDAEAHWCAALCRFGIEYVRDPDTLEWFPTCHRASFSSFLEDVDYLAALEHSDGVTRLQYRKDAAKIAEVQKGILATSQNEEPYDVFICFKDKGEDGQRTKDSILAQEIYYQLTERGHRVFFSRITLEGKGGAEYEPYIFAALNSAKVMVAVGTSPEHFNSDWVKNEWSRFLALMRKDRNKMLLPCYRDMDPHYLPEQLKILQSYDMAKIGFIQDLIHGVDKVVRAEKKPAVTETVVVQQNAATNAAALIKRGNMALEDGVWKKAEEFFDMALNQDAELAEAYLGLALAEAQCSNMERFIQKMTSYSGVRPSAIHPVSQDNGHIDEMVREYAIPGYLTAEAIRRMYPFDLTVQSLVAACEEFSNRTRKMLEQNRNLNRAGQYGSSELKVQLDEMKRRIDAVCTERVVQARQSEQTAIENKRDAYQKHLRNVDEQVRKLHESAAAKREKDYEAACALQSDAIASEAYDEAAAAFAQLQGYRDSEERESACRRESERIAAKEAEAERARKYDSLCKRQEGLEINRDYLALIRDYATMGDYRDCVRRKQAVEKMLEKYYERLCNMEKEAYKPSMYEPLVKRFEELGNYRDSRLRAAECRKKCSSGYDSRQMTATSGKDIGWSGSDGCMVGCLVFAVIFFIWLIFLIN